MGITVWRNLCDQAEEMARRALSEARTLEDWQRLRPQRRSEFLHAMGLRPMPARCDPKVTWHGTFEGPGFSARKIAFQILPDCWASACIYYPDPLPEGRLPGVLYVCGHAAIGTLSYQAHPIMWARRGYACLIVDTIEQNDNPGEHHGFLLYKGGAWLSLGYTSAGGEALNSLRALDVLAADERVDPERLGVTGVSGGGALSFFVAVLDERVKAVSTLCGISTPADALDGRKLVPNCDCLYPHNIYRRDISEYAALIAPRAAMFCFADHDGLFYPERTRALVERTRRVYGLYGLPERCKLVTCPGPHGDHPEFDDATARWFDLHVAGRESPPVRRGKRELPETVTNVFGGRPPAPNRIKMLPWLLSPAGTLPLPKTADDWPRVRREALSSLREQVFPPAGGDRPRAALSPAGNWAGQCAHRGQIEGVEVWLNLAVPPAPSPVMVLGIAGLGEFWRQVECRIAAAISGIASGQPVYGGFEPRLSGFNAPADLPEPQPPGSRVHSASNLLLRAMAIAGTSPVMMIMQDIGVAVDYLFKLDEMRGRKLYLYGQGTAGVAALYHALFDERVAGVALQDAPSSHLDGAPLTGVLRVLDIPQAVGLMAPRKVALVTAGHDNWTWAARVYERLECPERLVINCDDLRFAFSKIMDCFSQRTCPPAQIIT